MEWASVLEMAFAGIVGALFVVALLALYAGLGAWMDDAFENGRWIWFGLLLILLFPASLFAWLIMRVFRNRRRAPV